MAPRLLRLLQACHSPVQKPSRRPLAHRKSSNYSGRPLRPRQVRTASYHLFNPGVLSAPGLPESVEVRWPIVFQLRPSHHLHHAPYTRGQKYALAPGAGAVTLQGHQEERQAGTQPRREAEQQAEQQDVGLGRDPALSPRPQPSGPAPSPGPGAESETAHGHRVSLSTARVCAPHSGAEARGTAADRPGWPSKSSSCDSRSTGLWGRKWNGAWRPKPGPRTVDGPWMGSVAAVFQPGFGTRRRLSPETRCLGTGSTPGSKSASGLGLRNLESGPGAQVPRRNQVPSCLLHLRQPHNALGTGTAAPELLALQAELLLKTHCFFLGMGTGPRWDLAWQHFPVFPSLAPSHSNVTAPQTVYSLSTVSKITSYRASSWPWECRRMGVPPPHLTCVPA